MLAGIYVEGSRFQESMAELVDGRFVTIVDTGNASAPRLDVAAV